MSDDAIESLCGGSLSVPLLVKLMGEISDSGRVARLTPLPLFTHCEIKNDVFLKLTKTTQAT